MPLTADIKFQCSHCGQELEGSPELCGAVLSCPSCSGTVSVPSAQGATNIAPASPPLWNPNAAALWSLLFTPAFGSVLLHLNAKALGRENEANAFGLWILVSAMVHIGAIVAVQFTGENLFRFAGIALLIIWYFAAAKRQETFVKQAYGDGYLRKSWGLPLASGVAGIVALGFLVGNVSGLASGGSSGDEANKPSIIGSLLSGDSIPDVASIYESSGDEAVEAARRYMEDTWTYTEVEKQGGNPWLKFEMKPGGELLFYVSSPVDDDWGTPESLRWDIRSEKYANSGRRYYSVHFPDQPHLYLDVLKVVIERDGKVSIRGLADEPRELKRGDAFPFSD